MKKFIVLFVAVLTTAAAFALDPDEKLLQVFKTSFPNAQEVIWHEFPETYIANFTENGIRSKISYRKDGTLVQLTRTYQDQNLPYHINLKVKEQYPGKKIFGVVELLTKSDTENFSILEYYIKLEDEKTWTTVKVDNDGEMTVVEKYKKAL
jgi:hypothetical protein